MPPPPNIGAAWPVWYVADGDPVKVRELDRTCDIDDIADAIEYVDVCADRDAYNRLAMRGRIT